MPLSITKSDLVRGQRVSWFGTVAEVIACRLCHRSSISRPTKNVCRFPHNSSAWKSSCELKKICIQLVTFGFDYLHEDIRKVTVCKALFSWNQLHPQSANITRRSSTSITALLYRCFELVKQWQVRIIFSHNCNLWDNLTLARRASHTCLMFNINLSHLSTISAICI